MPNPNQKQNKHQNQSQSQNQNQNPNSNQSQNPNSNQNQNQNPHVDFSLKETSPNLGGGRVSGGVATAFDLVEPMQFLYVRVVKAKDLQQKEGPGSGHCFVEVRAGSYKAMTRHLEKKSNPEWSQVFAFSADRIHSLAVEVVVKDKEMGKDDFMGRVLFDLSEVPKRVPPDSPLAPQWYRLENQSGVKARGELMLAVWMGTQADESFPEAWHLDAAAVSGDGVAGIQSKVYLSPKLWYLRVNVIEAQELHVKEKSRSPEVYVKAMLGNVVLRTKISQSKNVNPMWNEDLIFVVAEPFEEQLVLSVEDKVAPNKDEILGKCTISLQNVERRLDNRPVSSRWYSLEKHVAGEGGQKKEVKAASSTIHLRICLEGGYHVLDELTQHSSDLRPTAKQLWRPAIGVLEVGILNAQGLTAMKSRDGHGTTDAYCVAKYGQKWIRTRTITDSFNPKWNEQYTWEVSDPCTVITIGVFDNCHLQGVDKGGGAKDSRIGKVRIRLSTLETDRVYTYSYPLIVLQPSGVKKMGEIQLAVRFTCASLLNMLLMYSQPLLPKMHYLHPLSVYQLDNLRHQVTEIVSDRLSRAEPPLRKEVVEYMLDVGSNLWSIRRSKANASRITMVLSGLASLCRWLDKICTWKSPVTTVLIHILFLILVIYPSLILSTFFLYLVLIGAWNYRWRPKHPPHMDTKLSEADAANPDELDEEFDTFPTSRKADVVRMRYDRLRSIASRMQTVVGDLATQGERFHNLLSWRDPRATALFLAFCLTAAILFYVTSIRTLIVVAGFYVLRHPRLRNRFPSVPLNFFRRLPARTDSLF